MQCKFQGVHMKEVSHEQRRALGWGEKGASNPRAWMVTRRDRHGKQEGRMQESFREGKRFEGRHSPGKPKQASKPPAALDAGSFQRAKRAANAEISMPESRDESRMTSWNRRAEARGLANLRWPSPCKQSVGSMLQRERAEGARMY